MKLTFNNRYNVAKGTKYFSKALLCKDPEVAGFPAPAWIRLGKNPLQLPPIPDEDSIHSLFSNRHPLSGERITLRSKSVRLKGDQLVHNYRASHEFTFAPTKCTTVVALPLGDKRVSEIISVAIYDAMHFLGRYVATRVRKSNQQSSRLTQNAIGLLVYELESRSGDPHLHSHGVLFNQTWDQVEHCHKAIEASEILKNQTLIERWATARMLYELTRMGYRTVRKGKSYRIDGIPKEAVECMSKRTSEIEGAVSEKECELQLPLSPNGRKTVALASRPNKVSKEFSAAMGVWKEELSPWWETLSAVVSEAKHRADTIIRDPIRSASELIDLVFERQMNHFSAVSKEQLLLRSLLEVNGACNGHHLESAIGRKISDGRIICDQEGFLRSPSSIDRIKRLAVRINGSRNDRPKLFPGIPSAELRPSTRELLNTRDSLACLRQSEAGLEEVTALIQKLNALSIDARLISSREIQHAFEDRENAVFVLHAAESLTLTEFEDLLPIICDGNRVWLLEKPNQKTGFKSLLHALRHGSWMRQISLGSVALKQPSELQRLKTLRGVVDVTLRRDLRRSIEEEAKAFVKVLAADPCCEIYADTDIITELLNTAIHRILMRQLSGDGVSLNQGLLKSDHVPCPGTVIEFTHPYPGIRVGRTERVQKVEPSGALILQSGKRIVADPLHYRLAYCQKLGTKKPWYKNGIRKVLLTKKISQSTLKALTALDCKGIRTEIVASEAVVSPPGMSLQELAMAGIQFWEPQIFDHPVHALLPETPTHQSTTQPQTEIELCQIKSPNFPEL